MTIKGQADIDGLMAVGKIVANCLQHMIKAAKPGMTTLELDQIGEAFLSKHKALSAPRQVYGFPGTTCISVNEEMAHGIPGSRVLQPGDLVNVDVSASLNGYFADTGGSFILPPATPEKEEVCRLAKLALDEALKMVKAGERLNLIGRTIEHTAISAGHTVIRNLGGHGVGRNLHEAPEFIQGYFDPQDPRLQKEGAVITIEPFISNGARFGYSNGADDWTAIALDHVTAQYEHTLIITANGPIIVTIPDQEIA